MKKIICIILCAALMLTLTGCLGDGSVKNPSVMADGSRWDGSWTGMGGYLGVEQPEGDFLLLTTNGDLDGVDLHYSTWIGGEETELEDGSYAYDCQLYLMTEDCGVSEDAMDTLALWREQLGGDFSVTEERTYSANGVDFTLVFYDCLAEDSHFASGVIAMGVWKSIVIVADLGKTADHDLDLTATIEDFLNGFHYA